MKPVKALMTVALSLPLVLLSGCQSIPSYSSDYSEARSNIQGIMFNEAKAHDIGTRFTTTFNTLGTSKFLENVSAMYAEKLFINDTLSQFSSREQLLDHFQGMNQRVSNVSVKLINTTYHQDIAYIHWHMTYDFKIFGTKRTMDSFGLTEVKLNSNHQIIFQQDFWDPANGLYRSLPYIGASYGWLLPFKKVQ